MTIDDQVRKTLTLHAAIVIFGGFVAGFFLASVATGDMQGNKADWNLAHMEGLLNGLFLLGVAGVTSALTLGDGQKKLLGYSFVGMAYCNLIFGLMRGATGASGLTFDGPLSNQASTFFGLLGVPLGVIGLALLALGALRKP